jgi:hypothetical protein
MYRSLTSTWREELRKMTMLAGGDPAKVTLLYPARAGPNSSRVPTPGWSPANSPRAASRFSRTIRIWSGPSRGVVSGASESARPGRDGVSLPGVPCVIIGHNQRIAWGVTNLGFDVQDLYIEKIDPQTGRYVFRGQVEQARPESEWIRVKGARPVEFRQWVTRHGPVAFEAKTAAYFALRWAAAEPGGFGFPFLD